MSTLKDAAALERLRALFSQHLQSPSVLNDIFEDRLASHQADQAAEVMNEFPAHGQWEHFLQSPNPYDPTDPPETRFADGGPVDTSYLDYGDYSAPNSLFNTPPSHAGGVGGPAQVYAEGGPYHEPGFHNLPNSMPQSGPMHYGSSGGLAEGGGVTSRLMSLIREELKKRPDIFWHGTPSGDLTHGVSGLHLGTHRAATEALETRIGRPAEGEWLGDRSYGDTLLSGRRRFLDAHETPTGINSVASLEDYLANTLRDDRRPLYSNGREVDLEDKPYVHPFSIVGPMANRPRSPYKDFDANERMQGNITRGNARRGLYYKNEAEDVGSISATVPGPSHVERVEIPEDFQPYADGGSVTSRDLIDELHRFAPRDWKYDTTDYGQPGVLESELARLKRHHFNPLSYGMEGADRLDSTLGKWLGTDAKDYWGLVDPNPHLSEDYGVPGALADSLSIASMGAGKKLAAIGQLALPALTHASMNLDSLIPAAYGVARRATGNDPEYPQGYADGGPVLGASLKLGSRLGDIGRYIAREWGQLPKARFDQAGDEANLERFNDPALRRMFDPAHSSLMTTMPPEAFEEFAKRMPSGEEQIPYQRWNNVPQTRATNKHYYAHPEEMNQDRYIDLLGKHIQKEGLDETPSLWMFKNQRNHTEIYDHEGRHRMRALSRLGDDSGLVTLRPTNSGELRRPFDERLEYLRDKYFPKGVDTPIVPQLSGERRPAARLYNEPFAEGGSVLTRLVRDIVGKPRTVNIPGRGDTAATPLRELEDISNKFASRRDAPPPITQYPDYDVEHAARVAHAFEDMKHNPSDPEVKRTYEALIDETMDQLRSADKLGLKFNAIKPGDNIDDAYRLAYPNLADKGQFSFFPTDQGFGSSPDTAGHPLLRKVGRVGDLPDATANDAFRVVHDLYGHFAPGNPFFDNAGEDRAFLNHARMYSRDALPALASETRGQNSWVTWGPHGEHNRGLWPDRVGDIIYAPQKAGMLPEWTHNDIGYKTGGVVDDVVSKIVKSWRTNKAEALDAEKKILNRGSDERADFISPPIDKRLQTVDDPRRIMYPKIYADPRDIVGWAKDRLVPDPGEEGPMYKLFGHTRQSLDELSRNNRPFDIPRPPSMRPFIKPEGGTGSDVSDQVLTNNNARRMLDVLELGRQDPDLRQMRSWYELGPLYDKMKGLGQTEKDMQAMNAKMAVMSPQASPAVEIPRGFMAHYLAGQGRLDDFVKYGALSPEQKRGMEGLPEEFLNADLGHKAHGTHVPNMWEHENLGRLWPSPKTHKVGTYLAASDPVLPYGEMPVADSHFTRMFGYPDVRTARTKAVLGQQMSNPEYGEAAPWWNKKVAAQLDERPRDSQALGWGLFGPATGVREIGSPKLELISNFIDEVARSRGIAPETARDQLLAREIGGHARGGSIDDDFLGYHSMYYADGGPVRRPDMLDLGYVSQYFDRGGYFRGTDG